MKRTTKSLCTYLFCGAVSVLTGCGGGGAGANSSASPLTGVFLDSAVGGISYRTETQSGITNSKGEFQYIAGETVTFSIGKIDLPSAVAAATITPLTLAGTSDVNNQKVSNILVLLQSLDQDGDPGNGITIPVAAAALATSAVSFDVSPDIFASNANVRAVVAGAGGRNTSLIATQTALSNFATTVNVLGVNVQPQANAGTAQSVLSGATVTLDGSQSTDINGDALTYSWALTVPAGSSAKLSSSTVVNPTFVADVAGDYSAALIVSDGKLHSTASTAQIAVSNSSAPNDSGSNNNTASTVSGKIIDGYVVGATVFLDLNFNGVQDAGEPNAISGTLGSYKMSLSESQRQCVGYAPLIVDVPVGAVDEDLGVVKEAYRISIPPRLNSISSTDIVNISPLTAVVWDVVEPQLAKEYTKLTCQTLLADQVKLDRIKKIISNSIDDVLLRYKTTAQKLYDDYISSQDGDSKALAIDIVNGLRASLSETLKLRGKYPSARYVKVNYHKSDYRDNNYAYPNAWYRETWIFGDGLTITNLEKVSDDFKTTIKSIIYGEISTKQINASSSLTTSYEFESRQGDASPYSCDSKEWYRTVYGSKRYEIVNLVSHSATKFSDCAVSSFQTETYQRYIFVDGVQNIFSKRPFPSLNDWFDFGVNITSLKVSDLANYADALTCSSAFCVIQ